LKDGTDAPDKIETDHIYLGQLKKSEKREELLGMMHMVSEVFDTGPDAEQIDVHSGLH